MLLRTFSPYSMLLYKVSVLKMFNEVFCYLTFLTSVLNCKVSFLLSNCCITFFPFVQTVKLLSFPSELLRYFLSHPNCYVTFIPIQTVTLLSFPSKLLSYFLSLFQTVTLLTFPLSNYCITFFYSFKLLHYFLSLCSNCNVTFFPIQTVAVHYFPLSNCCITLYFSFKLLHYVIFLFQTVALLSFHLFKMLS